MASTTFYDTGVFLTTKEIGMQICRTGCFLVGAFLTSVLGACTADSDTNVDPTTQDPTDTTDGRKVTNIREKLLYVVAVEKTDPGATPSPDALFTVDVKQGSPT